MDIDFFTQITTSDIKIVKKFYPKLQIPTNNPLYLSDNAENRKVFSDLFAAKKELNNNSKIKSEIYKLIGVIHKKITSNSKYLDFAKFQPLKPSAPPKTRDVYAASSDKIDYTWCISVDIISANFSCMKVFFPELVDNCDSWCTFIKQFTTYDFIIESKYIRQIILGKINNKKFSLIQKLMMSDLYAILQKSINTDTEKIFSLGNDELYITVPKAETFDQLKIIIKGLYDKIIASISFLPITMHKIFKVYPFCVKPIEKPGSARPFLMYDKRTISDITMLASISCVTDIAPQILCAPKELYIQAYKYVLGLPLQEPVDLICSKNDRCVSFDSEYKFDATVQKLFDIKSEIIELLVKYYKFPFPSNRPEALDYYHDLYQWPKLKSAIVDANTILSDLKNNDSIRIYVNNLAEKIQTLIKSKESYMLYTKSKDFAMKAANLPPTITLYKKNKVKDKYKIIIKLNKADFTTFKFFNADLVDGCATWQEFISKYTGYQFLANSKHLRKRIFGSIGTKKMKSIQIFLMTQMFHCIKNIAKIKGMTATNELYISAKKENIQEIFDKIILQIDTLPTNMKQLWKIQMVYFKPIGGSLTFLEKRIINNSQTGSKIKEIQINKDGSYGNIINANADVYSQAFKYVNGMMLSEQDKWTSTIGLDATFLEYLDFEINCQDNQLSASCKIDCQDNQLSASC